ncbi:MAG: GMC family oxidoreductase, partial [Gemmatimonadales bacterium]
MILSPVPCQAESRGYRSTESTLYDVIVIGSGLSGAMFARPLVHAGLRVLMIERGDWVPRDGRNTEPAGTLELTPFFTEDQAYRRAGRNGRTVRSCSCVGGQAVFFGGAVLRYREADFTSHPEIAGDSGARWPIGYDDLEPFYTRTEQVLNVAGVNDADPTEPPHSAPYPQGPLALSPVSQRIVTAAATLGLRPSSLPLAINYLPGPRACVACGTCDSYACPLGAKNDPASSVLPDLLARGLDLKVRTVAVRLETHAGAITQLVCHDRQRDRWVTYWARRYALAAGTLATPHLLLASGLDRLNPGGHTVGRYLMRHCNAVVFGVFPRRVRGNHQFHKQLCFFDYYFGHPEVARPHGKLGVIQQIHPPPPGLLRAMLPGPLGRLACAAVPHMAGLVVIAEDQPRAENRITLDHAVTDRYGLPQAVVVHRYTERDLAARRALVRAAKG